MKYLSFFLMLCGAVCMVAFPFFVNVKIELPKLLFPASVEILCAVAVIFGYSSFRKILNKEFGVIIA